MRANAKIEQLKMRGKNLLVWMLIQHIWTATSFERRSAGQNFRPMCRRTIPCGLHRLAMSHNKSTDMSKPEDDGRRSLLLGSATIFGSVFWSLKPRSARGFREFMEESEARRIDIFERNSPSVVFIDTFTEKRDQWTPSTLEVPLGSGSGFVWDKEGHIGKFQDNLHYYSHPFCCSLNHLLFSHKLPRDPKCQSGPSSYRHTSQEGNYERRCVVSTAPAILER